MTDNEQIIALLTEIRDLLKGDQTAVTATAGTEQRFTADKMTATVNDGKAYWKVRGGMFQKYGVTIWPEVLEAAGFDAAAMDPLTVYDLAGWTAVYILNEDGNAQKVTQLIAPANGQAQAAQAPTAVSQPVAKQPNPAELADSFLRIGDLVEVRGDTATKKGVIEGFGEDGRIAVKVNGQMCRVSPERVTALALA